MLSKFGKISVNNLQVCALDFGREFGVRVVDGLSILIHHHRRNLRKDMLEHSVVTTTSKSSIKISQACTILQRREFTHHFVNENGFVLWRNPDFS